MWDLESIPSEVKGKVLSLALAEAKKRNVSCRTFRIMETIYSSCRCVTLTHLAVDPKLLDLTGSGYQAGNSASWAI